MMQNPAPDHCGPDPHLLGLGLSVTWDAAQGCLEPLSYWSAPAVERSHWLLPGLVWALTLRS